MDTTVLLAILATLISTLYLYDLYLNSRLGNDPREPPVFKATNAIPIVGHVVGFVRHGIEYYTKLCESISRNPPRTSVTIKPTDRPADVPSVFTVRILGNFKLYVVNSTSMLGPLQRADKTVSFTPLERLSVQRLSAATPEELNLLDHPSMPGSGDGKLVHDINKLMMRALAPGPDLDEMNKVTATGFLEGLDKLTEQCEISDCELGATVIDLYGWVKDTVTIFSGRGAYGPESPYNDKEARDAFWAVEANLTALILGLSPVLPDARKGMKTIITHFVKYHSTDAPMRASGLIREREKFLRSYGLNSEQIGRWSYSVGIGIFSNTVATSFWLIWDLYSRAELLAELREALKLAVTTNYSATKGSATKHFTLDLSYIKARVPLLLSTFQEMQRLRTFSATIRKVLVDTTLDDGRGRPYLLKAGNYVQFPSQPVHKNSALFGEDVNEFNPKRFLSPQTVKAALDSTTDGDVKTDVKASAKKQPPFLPFGFAPHLCPGRQFAVSEIMILVALIVLRFDIEPADGHGWDESVLKTLTGTAATTPVVVGGKTVTLKVREEYKGEWHVEVGKSGERFKLAGG